MGKFAVIDTETNWADQVMSIGSVIADRDTFEMIEAKYHILPIECQIGGMYENTLFIETPVQPILCTRTEAIADLRAWFEKHGVRSISAYNACFDRNHLPELRDFNQSCETSIGMISCALPPIASTIPKFQSMLIAVLLAA